MSTDSLSIPSFSQWLLAEHCSVPGTVLRTCQGTCAGGRDHLRTGDSLVSPLHILSHGRSEETKTPPVRFRLLHCPDATDGYFIGTVPAPLLGQQNGQVRVRSGFGAVKGAGLALLALRGHMIGVVI